MECILPQSNAGFFTYRTRQEETKVGVLEKNESQNSELKSYITIMRISSAHFYFKPVRMHLCGLFAGGREYTV